MKILRQQKNIIALWGSADQGKSSTICKVIDLIKVNYPNASFNYIFQYGDIKVVIQIKNKKIGIESQGDPNSRLFSSLDDFARVEQCDLILCSCRTSGSTVNAIHQISQQFLYNIIWSTNHRSSLSHNALNDLSAKNIFELINGII